MQCKDRVEEAVQTAIVNILGVDEDEIHPDLSLAEDLGADSFELVEIGFEIEDALDIEISAQDLGPSSTVGQMCGCLRSKVPQGSCASL